MFLIFIFLAAPGLNCRGSLASAYGIQFPDQESIPGPLHWEHGVLATGPPGKSPNNFKMMCAL